jgi:hypothetical protein
MEGMWERSRGRHLGNRRVFRGVDAISLDIHAAAGNRDGKEKMLTEIP